MSVEIKEEVHVEHVDGCGRNKGCDSACKRNKKKGAWEAHITVRPPGKKPIRKRLAIPSEYTKTLTERRWWAEQQEELIKKSVTSNVAENYTVAQLVEEWIAERKADDVPSLKDDEPNLRRHVLKHMGGLRLAEVRRRHAVELIAQLKRTPSPRGGLLAPRTVRTIFFTVHAVFEYACLKEYIVANPIKVPRGVLPKAEDKDPAWRDGAIFPAAEVASLIHDTRVSEHRRVRYAIEFLAGLRTGQASALRWRDYDPEAEPLGRITSGSTYDSRNKKEKDRTKTGVTHRVPVHPVLARILAEWKLSGWRRWMGRDPKPDDLILPTKIGGHRDARKALAQFHEDLAVLELRRRRHYDTRRTFISLALDGGASKDLLKKITHPRPQDAFDLYRSESWATLSEQVKCIRIPVHEGKVIAFRPTPGTSEDGARMAPGAAAKEG